MTRITQLRYCLPVLILAGLLGFHASLQAELITTVSIFDVSSEFAPRPAINIINGSGLNEDGVHDTTNTNMWFTDGSLPAEIVDFPQDITFDLGSTTLLGNIHVWNYNELPTDPQAGFGAKDVEIWVSPDANPANLVKLDNDGGDFVFASATGSAATGGEDDIGFDVVMDNVSNAELLDNVRLVRFNILTSRKDEVGFPDIRYVGLSEVQFDDAPQPRAVLTVDRDNGKVTLTNAGQVPISIQGYSITSETGSLASPDSGVWTPVSGNYDNSAGPGNGFVDSDDDWMVLSQPDSHTDMSEFQLVSGPGLGDGGSIAVGNSVEINVAGGGWLQSDVEDLIFKLADAEGKVSQYSVEYINGNSGEAFDRSDLNFDGDVNADDWPTFVNNYFASMDGLSSTEAYRIGDLNRDGVSGTDDLDLFRFDFEAANGPGSFAAMLAGVPEPSSLVLLLFGVGGALAWKRRTLRPLACWLALTMASFIGQSSASAALGLIDNTGFEDDISLVKYVAAGDVPKWEEFDSWNALGSLVWTYDNGVDTFFPPKSGDGALGFILNDETANVDNPQADEGWVFQTLGVATAGDIGKTLTLDVNAGARADASDVDFTVAFRHGTTGSNPGEFGGTATLGTVLGTAGTLNYPSNPATPPAMLAVPTATYTVQAGDVGLEVFAVVSADMGTFKAGVNNQYVLDDVVLGNPYAQFDTLTIVVNRITGDIALQNNSPEGITFDYYDLKSAGGSLDPSWSGLSDLNLDPVDGGDDPGETWDEAGGASSEKLAELFLLGTTTLAAGAEIILEDAYDTNVDAMDLEFVFHTASPPRYKTDGFIEYLLHGDMNNDGTVDDSDVNPFVEALTNRADFVSNHPDVDADVTGDFNGNGKLDLGDTSGFKAAVAAGVGSGSGSTGAVPEPTAIVLVFVAIFGVGATRSRQWHRTGN